MNLNITQRLVLPKIPSASGIEVLANSIYIIGDNSPWLFQLNLAGETVDQFQIYGQKNTTPDTIPKAVKPDFEAMTVVTLNGTSNFYIFGSASKSPQRELLVRGTPNEPDSWTQFNLSDFFKKLKADCQLSDEDLNIEAAIATHDSLYLFNRGKNAIIQFSLHEFEAFITGKKEVLGFKTNTVELPKINEIQTGFSGAALIPGQDKIIFTASAENTANWIDDGEISGSCVGILDLKNFTILHYAMFRENDAFLPLKIESVAIRSCTSHKMELLFVSDQDGGVSELISADLLY